MAGWFREKPFNRVVPGEREQYHKRYQRSVSPRKGSDRGVQADLDKSDVHLNGDGEKYETISHRIKGQVAKNPGDKP